MKAPLVKFCSLVVGLFVLTSLNGCGILSNAIEDLTRTARSSNNQKPQPTPVGDSPAPSANSDGQGDTKTIVGTDNKIQVIVPVDWQEDRDLNAKADLQASNRRRELYLIVLSENKSDLANMTRAKHSELTRDILIKNLASPKVSGPTELKIGNNPAIQYQIEGTIDNLNVTYLHTTVETATSYHQIIAWTLRSQFPQDEPKLQAVIQSFRETGAQ